MHPHKQRFSLTSGSALLRGLLSAFALAASTFAWAGPGADIYNEYVEKEAIYPDEDLQDYITAIGERILAVGPHKGRNYTFTVIDEPIVNAFATGDAYIFITRGILAHFNSEDELAGVIGHEIGHVVGQHSRKTNNRARLGSLLGLLGAFATGSNSTVGLSNSLTQAVVSDYGRQNELEADEYGAEWLARAGYNPRAMLDSIQMLRDHDDFQKSVSNRPTVYHGILGSHPAHAKRLNELVNQSQHIFPDELSEPEGDFHEMLQGLSYGSEASTGVVKDGVYYHGSLRLRIAFPKDWPVRATASEVFGTAPKSDSDAKIGVKRQSPPEDPQTPLEYLTETLRRDDLQNGKEIQVGPYSGYIADLDVASGDAQARSIAVLFKDGGIYLFSGELGQNGDVETYRKQFEETVMSFRAMTAADLRLVNNQKLKIIVAEPGQTYAQLARNIPLKAHGEATLRVLNGHHPRGEPRAGDYIKVVE